MKFEIKEVYTLYSNREMPEQKGCMVLLELTEGASGCFTLQLDEDVTQLEEAAQVEAVKRHLYKELYAGKYQTEVVEEAKTVADQANSKLEEINAKLDDVVKAKVAEFNEQLSNKLTQALDDFKAKADEITKQVEAGKAKIDTLADDFTAFKKQITSKELTPEDKKEINAQYPEWVANQAYKRGDVVKYGDKLYQVTTEHTSAATSTPDRTATYYVEYHNPSTEKVEVIDEWKQPVDAKTSYMVGNKVKHNGFTWECLADYVKVEPAVTSPVWKKIG